MVTSWVMILKDGLIYKHSYIQAVIPFSYIHIQAVYYVIQFVLNNRL
jgi:hypothetical protein